MKAGARLGAALMAALVVVAALFALNDATQYRGERGEPGDQTLVDFDVETRRYRHGQAATALWSTCVGILGPSSSAAPARRVDGTYRAWVRPALGEDARRRLRGCLHDTTIDRVMGRVVSMINEPADQADSG